MTFFPDGYAVRFSRIASTNAARVVVVRLLDEVCERMAAAARKEHRSDTPSVPQRGFVPQPSMTSERASRAEPRGERVTPGQLLLPASQLSASPQHSPRFGTRRRGWPRGRFPRIQIIPVQDRIEPQEVRPLGLPSPERPDPEHHDMPVPDFRIEYLGSIS